MNQKKKYKLAGVIFAAILIYRLYGAFYSYKFLLRIQDFRVIIFNLITNICYMVPLILLSISAFKNKTKKKTKSVHIFFFLSGMLFPVLMSLKHYQFYISQKSLLYTAIQVVLFLYAACSLMKTNVEEKVETPLVQSDDKMKYYEGLLEKGVITQEELDSLRKNYENMGE